MTFLQLTSTQRMHSEERIDPITLERLYKEYIPIDQEIHFLKIDVEGFEKNGPSWK